MRIYRAVLGYQKYQAVRIPNGAAPLGASLIDDENDPEAGNIGLFYLSEDSLLEVGWSTFGAHVIETGGTLPDDVRIFPVQHPLTQTVDYPNARFVATVNNHHLFLGNPR